MSLPDAAKSVLEVPVIDISALTALKDDASVAAELREDNPALADVISNVRAAATEWGFFYIENHGISEQELEVFQSATHSFFALPKDVKNALRRREDNSRGYFDSELTKNKLDWKEVLDISGRHEDGPPESSVYERHRNDQNQWPSDEELPGFRPVMTEYFDKVEHIARRLTQVFAVALGERSDFFDQFFRDSSAEANGTAPKIVNTSALRLNYYPPAPEPEKTMGVYHHTDSGTVTVLLQDDEVASLQVLHRETQQWTTVPPKKNTYVINIGDMVQVWSNDKFLAPLHRVLANGTSTRYSAAFFYEPSYSADVRSVVVGEGEKPLYHPIKWGDFRRKRAEGNYADLGEEVQISHYKVHP